jgi:mercuric ion binding protein
MKSGSGELIPVGDMSEEKEVSAMRLFTIVASLLMATVSLHAKEVTAMIRVPAMDCDACTVVIKRALTQTKGVKTVDLNVEKRTATIIYEDTQVTEPQIEKAIEKAGFKTERSK